MPRAVRTTVSRLVEGNRTEYGAGGCGTMSKPWYSPFKEVMPLARNTAFRGH